MLLEMKTVRLRLVEESDAEFILKLRTDKKYNKFLSPVTPDLEGQKQWIRRYKYDESEKKQFYFIIEKTDGTACGTVRVYDLKENSFCWGSWILNENKTKYAALESAFLVYRFGFNFLGYEKSHFDVRKENIRVIKFHEKMGAVKTGEDKKNFYFEISKESVKKAEKKLQDKINCSLKE
jgi:RimJ/RimL family protein N-acetyltransferase